MFLKAWLLAVLAAAQYAPSGEGDVVVERCLVRPQRDVRIAAEEGGVLIEVPVEEGDRVKAGETLARIDDRQAKAALHVAEIALNAALKRASDDIDERFAQKAAEVAYVDWKGDEQANEEQPGAVPLIQVREKRLAFERAKLQIERAANEQVLAGLDADTKKAERDAAQTALERLTLAAPFDGEIVDVYADNAEWVGPGDPVMRLIRRDQMHVDGFVLASEYDADELLDRPVTVEVVLARGRKVTFKGRITHCGALVQGDNTYLVRAEIENRRDNGVWQMVAGLNQTTMTIHINQTAGADNRATVK
ncbi:MAG: HlyD family efflux transporter periplasmic adaptor subunit [Planctomycetota bacterium]